MALADAPAAISVIGAEQIAERGADNVLDAVRGEIGITVFGRTISGRKSLSLRGMDPRHTLFLVDGKRIGASDGVVGHSDFQLDWVPAEDIERIEIVRGPMSVLYGAEALGGVVNLITRPTGEAWTFAALAEGSRADGGRGGDGRRATLRAAGAVAEAWRLAVTAADVRRQAVADEREPRLSAIEGRHKTDAAAQLSWLPAPGHRIELEHRAGQEERWADVRERSGARRWHQSTHEIARDHDALGWTADWAGPWQGSSLLRAYRSRIEVDNSRTQGVAALRPQTLDDRVLEGQVSVLPGAAAADTRLTSGFEWRDERLANEGLPGGAGRARHEALFAQGEWSLGAALDLTLGLRRDRHERFGTEWSPRAYAVWRLAPQWTLKGGVGHGFKAPTLKQISPGCQEDEGPSTFFGNAALRPESNDAAELGIGWDTPAAGATLMAFHNRVRDLIVPRLFGMQGPRAQYVFENIDRAVLRGWEAATTVRLGGGFASTLNYQYLDARDGAGARLEKRPRHTVGASLDWRGGAWRGGLRLEHAAGQLLASTTPGEPPQAVPALSFVGLDGGVELGHGVELRAGVNNLGGVSLADKSPLFTYAEAPRTWRLSLRGRW